MANPLNMHNKKLIQDRLAAYSESRNWAAAAYKNSEESRKSEFNYIEAAVNTEDSINLEAVPSKKRKSCEDSSGSAR